MIGWIAPTDPDWFDFLAQGPRREEVNFWTPSDFFTFRTEPGTPFFFKLKAPRSVIAGFGYFVRYDALPEWLAWDCFHEANGAPTFDAMKSRLDGIRQRNRMQGRTDLEQIGCIILADPMFFPPELWIPQPADWPSRNLRPMRYDLEAGEGKRVWDHCLPTAMVAGSTESMRVGDEMPKRRWGNPVLMRLRLGQGAFRLAVTDAYGRSCAVTKEHSLPVLEAAHIRPFSDEGPHEITNGLLLRSDLHRLFDRGYVTVTPDHHFEVSPLLKEHFDNGHSYYPLHGRPIALPQRADDRPRPEWLQWHNERVFLG